MIEAVVDDMTPEELGFFVERALAEGAIDVYFTPVQMKKNRPGVAITVIGATDAFERLSRLVFRETTTIGFRYRESDRRVLDRETVSVETPAGTIRVKVARLAGEVVNVAPEFDDCREAALRSGLSLHEIRTAAIARFGGENR